jgi:hypothetical protein
MDVAIIADDLTGVAVRQQGTEPHLRGYRVSHLTPQDALYLPECMKGAFCEVRIDGVLGNSYRTGSSS